MTISAAAALVALVVARVNFPLPSRLEHDRTAPAKDFDKSYWLYMLAGALFAAGLVSFELMSYALGGVFLCMQLKTHGLVKLDKI